VVTLSGEFRQGRLAAPAEARKPAHSHRQASDPRAVWNLPAEVRGSSDHSQSKELS